MEQLPILPIFYAGPIEYYAIMIQKQKFELEQFEHFVKQTYRNRCSIYGANGKLNLIIPLDRTGKRRTMKEVITSTEERWQNLHWRSLQAAYRSSPYFEYYESDLVEHYEKPVKYLVDFNLGLHEKIKSLLVISFEETLTKTYQNTEDQLDYRNKFEAKKENTLVSFENKEYIQVFSDKHGFISNLSIFDLLFNEGPNTINYLKSLG